MENDLLYIIIQGLKWGGNGKTKHSDWFLIQAKQGNCNFIGENSTEQFIAI